MKKKLNLAVLKNKQDEMERKELNSIRSGEVGCPCADECEGKKGHKYNLNFANTLDGLWSGGTGCPCGSIWVAFGLA